MGTDTYSGPLGEIRAASTASGGTALTTTAVLIQIPLNTRHVFVTPRNFAGAVVARFAFNPWLVVLRTNDSLATAPTDYSELAQDASTSTSVDLSSLSTLANGDFVLVGSHLPFRGVSIDVDGANGNASVLTVAYWNGIAWVTTSATDGTDSGGASLGIDGTVTWTVPAAWETASLKTICAQTNINTTLDAFNEGNAGYAYGVKMYWTRWVWSAALDSAVTLDSMLALNRSTAYGELLPGQTHERRVHRGIGGLGCIEALTDAGTASLIVNVDSGNGGEF